jgi:hypothetical protein
VIYKVIIYDHIKFDLIASDACSEKYKFTHVNDQLVVHISKQIHHHHSHGFKWHPNISENGAELFVCELKIMTGTVRLTFNRI